MYQALYFEKIIYKKNNQQRKRTTQCKITVNISLIYIAVQLF